MNLSILLLALLQSTQAHGECRTCYVTASPTPGAADSASATVPIDDPNHELVAGELYFTLDAKGARRGILQILELKDSQRAGRLVKGEAIAGQSLLLRTRAKPETPTSVKTEIKQTGAPLKLARHWRFGLGISVFSVNGAGAIDGTNVTPGATYMVSGGVFYEFQLAPRSRLSTGLQYYQGGLSSNSTDSNPSGISESLVLNYVGLPVVYKYVCYSGSDLQWLLKAGPMVSRLLSSSFKISAGSVSLSQNDVVSVKTDVLATVGVELLFLPSLWWVDFDFDYGLINIASSSTNSSAMNNVGGILLAGFSF